MAGTWQGPAKIEGLHLLYDDTLAQIIEGETAEDGNIFIIPWQGLATLPRGKDYTTKEYTTLVGNAVEN